MNQESEIRVKVKTKTRGFSLVEVLLSVSLFVVIISAFIGAIIYGRESTALSGARSRATFLAEEGLEAVRNIRDPNFNNLADGTFGLTTTGNQWNLSGSSDTTDTFTRQIVISTVDTKRKNVIASVTWQQNQQRSDTVTLTTYLTNWQNNAGPTPTSTPTPGPTSTPTPSPTPSNTPTPTPATCAEYCISLGGYTTGTCRKGVPQCTANGETNEHGGNPLCTQAEGGTCCCKP